MHRSLRILLPTLAVTTASSAWGASSQNLSPNLPPPKPEHIVVTATGLSRASSATKTHTPIIESPQTISIVSRDEIELRAATSIADALSYTAGVQAEPQGIDSRVDEVSVRGFGAGGFSSNNNFLDGLRLPAGGMWTRPAFDPFSLQQIEVLKGPSGALYGQTAPGGLVNMVSKRPSKKDEREFFLQGTGFTNLKQWQGQISGDISKRLDKSGHWSGRIVALAKHGDTQVNSTSVSRYYVSPSLTWAPTGNTNWTLLAQYQRDQGGSTYQFLPMTGTLHPSRGRFIANDAFLGEPDWNVFDRSQVMASSFLAHRFNHVLSIRNNTRYTYLDNLYRASVLMGDTLTKCAPTLKGCIPGETIARRATEGRGRSQGVATDTQIEGRLTTGPVRHVLLAGTDYFYTRWASGRDIATNPSIVLPILNIFNPQSRGANGYDKAMIPSFYNATTTTQNGIYFQDQLSLGQFRATIGGRQDWAHDETRDVMKDRTFTTNSNAFTWRAGGVYLFKNGLTPYFSYARSFQPQVSDPTTSATGTPFKPTTGDQIETGIRYQYQDSIYITFGGYQIHQHNMTTPDPSGALCGNTTCLTQTGTGRVRGLEFEGRANLPWDMAILFTATRMDATITQSSIPSQIGNRLTQSPNWMGSLFAHQKVSAGLLRGTSVGGGFRYTGSSYGNITNTIAIPDYTVFDLFASYDFGVAHPQWKNTTFSFNIRNIANRRFVATCSSPASCFYGQGRTATARLEYRW